MVDRTSGQRTLTFDFGAGLVKDNLLVVDRETDSVWSQLDGRAIAGPLSGEPLRIVPAVQTTWGFWRGLHPGTGVVRIEGVEARPYRYRSRSAQPAGSARGTAKHDTRDLGLGLVRGGEALFASLDGLARHGSLAITLGGEPITLRAAPEGLTAWAEDGSGRLLPGVLAYRDGWLDFHPDARLLPVDAAAIEVRALANEGFLLAAGDDAVAIDAFVAEPYSVYAALDGEPLALLVAGAGPFASLDVALASHHHRDHFQGEPAQRFLAERPDCVFASSPQVIDALWEAETEAAPGVREDAIRAILPEPGREEVLEVGAIRIEFLRLSHGTGRFASIQNLGHVVTLGGVTALHVGDAEMMPASFAPYRLGERGIDVAFVPYWYFDDPTGRRIVDEHFRPAKLVACHVPPRELEAVTARLARHHPDVLVPQEAFEVFQVRDENR